MLLKNKVAVITGGAGVNGLGFATARQMAAQGAKVVIVDLARAEPAAAAARLGDGHLGLARAMAREFGAEGIRVNCITQGLIETDITQGKLSPEKKTEIAQTIPLNRLGRADDVAGACVFLASDLSAYCTGVTLDVNGG